MPIKIATIKTFVCEFCQEECQPFSIQKFPVSYFMDIVNSVVITARADMPYGPENTVVCIKCVKKALRNWVMEDA